MLETDLEARFIRREDMGLLEDGLRCDEQDIIKCCIEYEVDMLLDVSFAVQFIQAKSELWSNFF